MCDLITERFFRASGLMTKNFEDILVVQTIVKIKLFELKELIGEFKFRKYIKIVFLGIIIYLNVFIIFYIHRNQVYYCLILFATLVYTFLDCIKIRLTNNIILKKKKYYELFQVQKFDHNPSL